MKKKRAGKQIPSEEYENNNEKIISKYINNELKLRETLRELDKNLGIYLVKSSSINQTLPSKHINKNMKANQIKNMYKNKEEIREKGASIIHDVWSHWQNYLHSKGKTISDENWERWERQLRTPYNLLSEEEKESDRQIFDKFYKDFIHQIRQDDLEAVKEMITKNIKIYSLLQKHLADEKAEALQDLLNQLNNLNK